VVAGIDLFGLDEVEAKSRLRTAIAAAISGRAKPNVNPPFPGSGRGSPRAPSHDLKLRSIAARIRFLSTQTTDLDVELSALLFQYAAGPALAEPGVGPSSPPNCWLVSRSLPRLSLAPRGRRHFWCGVEVLASMSCSGRLRGLRSFLHSAAPLSSHGEVEGDKVTPGHSKRSRFTTRYLG
jgi:hypothetical protein